MKQKQGDRQRSSEEFPVVCTNIVERCSPKDFATTMPEAPDMSSCTANSDSSSNSFCEDLVQQNMAQKEEGSSLAVGTLDSVASRELTLSLKVMLPVCMLTMMSQEYFPSVVFLFKSAPA